LNAGGVHPRDCLVDVAAGLGGGPGTRVAVVHLQLEGYWAEGRKTERVANCVARKDNRRGDGFGGCDQAGDDELVVVGLGNRVLIHNVLASWLGIVVLG
jgi:hypothetical protein